MERRAEFLGGGLWRPPRSNWLDLAALILIVAIILLLGSGARQMLAPYSPRASANLAFARGAAGLRTANDDAHAGGARRLADLHLHLWHAGGQEPPRRDGADPAARCSAVGAGARLSLVHGRVLRLVVSPTALGAELAAIFAIFTSQAWNMAFSFYQSLRTIPHDLDEASRSFRFSGWQRFWRLEVPFAMPGLIWNTMMSMSGGWFFVVASEAISVGDLQIALPGIGSYVARAIEAARSRGGRLGDRRDDGHDLHLRSACCFVRSWPGRTNFVTSKPRRQIVPRSWVLDLFRRTSLLRTFAQFFRRRHARRSARAACAAISHDVRATHTVASCSMSRGSGFVLAAVGYLAWELLQFAERSCPGAMSSTSPCERRRSRSLRVVILIVIATLIWVPIGVAVGLRPAWPRKCSRSRSFSPRSRPTCFFRSRFI